VLLILVLVLILVDSWTGSSVPAQVSILPATPLVSPKFLHVPLGIGGLPLG